MKLLEILARELEVWPEWALELYQDPFGKVEVNSYLADKMESLGKFTVAEDHALSIIGKPEWQAERDRMKAMETQQATASTEPTYEQQLWDRAAVAVTQAFITAHITHFGYENVWPDNELVSCAADYADAFMAERAKRVGK